MAVKGGRQWAETIDGIADNHVLRYRFAVDCLKNIRTGRGKPTVLDVGCGCGYGSDILADAGFKVIGIDIDEQTIAFAKEHYTENSAEFRCRSAMAGRLPKADAIVAFEVLEHVRDAKKLLQHMARSASVLIGSVPNEAVLPHDKANNPYHHRHFTAGEIGELLAQTGWLFMGDPYMFSQAGKRGFEAVIKPDRTGQTLIFTAETGG